jgi:hypothetical protein
LIMARPSVEDRFLAYVMPEPNSGCWLWLGAVSTSGYGHITVNGRQVRAHRLSYELFKGQIKELDGVDARGTCVLHSCDMPLCVNPDHLRLGTHADNMLDKRKRGRFVSCPLLGEQHQNSKLKAAQVRRIREMAVLGHSIPVIATEMGVHRATIGDVLTGRTWSHVV